MMNIKIVKFLLKTAKGIFIGVLAVVLLLNAIRIGKRVFLNQQMPLVLGFGNAVIVTGSMEPAIAPGDMVIVHRQTDYQAGDIVTYQSNSPVTHRITQKTPDGYITQGDANNTDDGEIERSRIIGKVVLIIPNVGHMILFFQSPFGMLVLIVGLFVIIEAPRIYKNFWETYRASKGGKYRRR